MPWFPKRWYWCGFVTFNDTETEDNRSISSFVVALQSGKSSIMIGDTPDWQNRRPGEGTSHLPRNYGWSSGGTSNADGSGDGGRSDSTTVSTLQRLRQGREGSLGFFMEPAMSVGFFINLNLHSECWIFLPQRRSFYFVIEEKSRREMRLAHCQLFDLTNNPRIIRYD